MYLRASNVSLYFKLNEHHDDLPDAPADRKLGGMIETYKGQQFVRALDDISLDLRQGDRLAVIGHNGSGKSTLLRVLAGIYHPQQGSVECDRAVSSLFNISLGFRAEASGYRNILLKGLIAGKTPAQIQQALPEIAEFTELGPYLHMPLRTYSQGMAMRLAFAIATAFSNDILLMDEWIGAGDAQFLEKAVRRMTSFVESAQILVLASHSATLLRRVANKAIWLESGRIRAVGAVDDLLKQYESDAKASARAKRVAAPIIKDRITLTVTPSDLPDWVPGMRGVVGEVSWDAADSGVDAVEIYSVNPHGKESLCLTGGPVGRGETGPWLRPGFGFRLKDGATDEVLASAVVGSGIKSDPSGRSDPIALTITPAQILDWVRGAKGVVGEVSWDASGSSVEAVEIYSVNPQGKENLCFSGGPVGREQTGPWLRPGSEFRLKGAGSDNVLASAIVTGAVYSESNPSRREISLAITPSELPEATARARGVVGNVSWDASGTGLDAVEIYSVNPLGKENLWFIGGAVGQEETGPWLRPGSQFRLRGAGSEQVLATAIVGVDHRSAPGVRPGRITLTVTPADITDWRPGSKVIGEVRWDARNTGLAAVEIYSVNAEGKETLCFGGGPSGRGTTGPWLRPGSEFRLKGQGSSDVLATVVVGSGVKSESSARG